MTRKPVKDLAASIRQRLQMDVCDSASIRAAARAFSGIADHLDVLVNNAGIHPYGATLMLAEALQAYGIAMNSMSPGWVRTDMGGPAAARSAEEGADTVVWLATEAPQQLTGKFFRDRQEIPW
jgi:NAD(P)-dependent dehydrogenase (short-subunit alcohol dehydrogenase family)